MMELLDTQADIAARADPVPLPDPLRGTIALENVMFRYPSRPNEPALRNLSLRRRRRTDRGRYSCVACAQRSAVPAPRDAAVWGRDGLSRFRAACTRCASKVS